MKLKRRRVPEAGDSARKEAYHGLVNLAYEVTATTTKSVVMNLATGQDAFSNLNIGVGDFALHIRNGKLSLNIADNLDNVATMYGYSRGFLDVARNRADVKFSKTSFGPRFIEKKFSRFGVPPNAKPGDSFASGEKRYMGFTSRAVSRNGDRSFNLFGASFLTSNSSGTTMIHESFHSIDNNLRGKFTDYLFLGGTNPAWYEKRIGYGY